MFTGLDGCLFSASEQQQQLQGSEALRGAANFLSLTSLNSRARRENRLPFLDLDLCCFLLASHRRLRRGCCCGSSCGCGCCWVVPPAAALRAAPQSKNQRRVSVLPDGFEESPPNPNPGTEGRQAELLHLSPNGGGVHGDGKTQRPLGLQHVAGEGVGGGALTASSWPLDAPTLRGSRSESHACWAVRAKRCPVPRSAATWSAGLPTAASR